MPEARPRLEVADIFRAYGEAYWRSHALSRGQTRVLRDIELCRTMAMGGHRDVCDTCGYEVPAYNSCRNRHCPKCQALAQARWIDERKARILPTQYFHVVFTLPAELRPLALRNREIVFNLIFAAASETLLDLARDPKRLGARIGFTAVLHTWARDLRFHPHLHCIVTGGGLTADGSAWSPTRCRGRYLFPGRVLGDLFRGKFLAGLRSLRDDDRLSFDGCCADLAPTPAFDGLLDTMYRTDWVVYAKRPFAGAEHVYEYLGRYTHRTGISNHRLRSFDDRGVTFATKDGKSITVAPDEFIRRFLLHVLPDRFVKIRHYGLLAPSNATTALERARQLLLEQTSDPPPSPPPTVRKDWRELLLDLTGHDISRCPRCGVGKMIRHPLDYVAPRPHRPEVLDSS
jgi:hypothetical protein